MQTDIAALALTDGRLMLPEHPSEIGFDRGSRKGRILLRGHQAE